MAIDTCFENFFGAVLKDLAASTLKCRPRADPRPPIPSGIQDKIRLKNRLWRQWQFTRDPTLEAEVKRLQRSVTRRVNEWRNDKCCATLESLDSEDQSLWRMTKRVVRVPIRLPLVTTGRIALSYSEKAEALVDSLETQFQPVTDPLVPAGIKMFNVALRSYSMTPASEPKLTNPEDVQEAIMFLKVSEAPGPNSVPKRD
jgi:hypothetical protein